jgi:hypothetical protein
LGAAIGLGPWIWGWDPQAKRELERVKKAAWNSQLRNLRLGFVFPIIE